MNTAVVNRASAADVMKYRGWSSVETHRKAFGGAGLSLERIWRGVSGTREDCDDQQNRLRRLVALLHTPQHIPVFLVRPGPGFSGPDFYVSVFAIPV